MTTKKNQKSLLIVYTGNGKGKTTAAMGMAFRALGRKWKVAVMQFIKGKWTTGERKLGEKTPGLSWHVMGLGFTWESKDLAKDKEAAQQAWETSVELINSGNQNIVILDEITYAINYEFICLKDVINTLQQRPESVHVVITGRNAPQEIIDMADLVTEMKPIKHPYEQGIPAQMGIDF